jgi:hypothetical protein
MKIGKIQDGEIQILECQTVPNLSELQNFVGGHIEVFYPFFNNKTIALVVNEEGEMLHLSPTCLVISRNRVLLGNIWILGVKSSPEGTEFTGLSPRQIERITKGISISPENIELALKR